MRTRNEIEYQAEQIKGIESRLAFLLEVVLEILDEIQEKTTKE